jgi:hypothetical protein
MRPVFFSAALLLLPCIPSAFAATRHVNAATGVDSGDCTGPSTPCKTIAYAMGQAASGSPGDLVSVAPGTYNSSLGEFFPITVRSGVQLVSTGTAENTVIDAAGVFHRVLETATGANAFTLIDGFTITGGRQMEFFVRTTGGGLLIDGGSPTIRNNIFLANEARGPAPGPGMFSGGAAEGGAIFGASGTPTIVNNVFRGNVARGASGIASSGGGAGSGGAGRGGAIYITTSGGTIANNTFYGNSAIGGNSGGSGGNGGNAQYGALYSDGALVNNNIFDANSAVAGAGGVATFGAMQYLNAPSDASNNLFHANTVNGVASTTDTIGTASRCFSPSCPSVGYHAEPVNLRIRLASPASGAGTPSGAPTDDLDGITRPNPPSIGAFEPHVGGSRMNGISTRMQVLTDDNVLISGFIIDGTTAKNVVIRARGPSLSAQGVAGALADPILTLVPAVGSVVTNDNWGDAPNASEIQSLGLAPSNSRESAILATLGPGPYTAIVQGDRGGTGVGIVEVFEVDHPDAPLIGISTRGRVLTDDNVMIGGFIISGTEPRTVVVRARGPSLASQGVAGTLQNPLLQLVFAADATTITNDDWGTAANAGTLQAIGFAPSDPLEAAILVTLTPGAYTAIVSGAGGTTGVAIVEVYAAP